MGRGGPREKVKEIEGRRGKKEEKGKKPVSDIHGSGKEKEWKVNVQKRGLVCGETRHESE